MERDELELVQNVEVGFCAGQIDRSLNYDGTRNLRAVNVLADRDLNVHGFNSCANGIVDVLSQFNCRQGNDEVFPEFLVEVN